jgi:hypothetical protein
MYIDKAQAKVKQAENLLLSAQEELLKSKDDVVLFTACSKSRQSITQFLTAYLLKNGYHPESNESISDLLQHCVEIDPRFKKININEMHCSVEAEDSRFCTDIKKIRSCVDIAVQTQKLIDFTSDHWPISKHVK